MSIIDHMSMDNNNVYNRPYVPELKKRIRILDDK